MPGQQRVPYRVAAATLVAATLVAGCGQNADSGPQTVPPVELVKPTAEVAFDRTFAWRPIDTATSYRVLVFNPAGERAFEVRDVKGTSVALAKSVVLPPGRYSWQVLAFKDQTQLSESPPTTFDMK